MMKEPTKKDFMQARDVWAARVVNIRAELVAAEAGFNYCQTEADSLPEDPEDPMPESAKEMLK